eukprot:3433255-Alexandrium_andersonii.AAC.1
MAGTFSCGDQRALSGAAILGSWVAGAPASSAPFNRCLVLPLPLATVVVSGVWQRILFSGHALRFRPRLFQHWPPASFWAAAAQARRRVSWHGEREHEQSPQSAGHTVRASQQLRELADELRTWHGPLRASVEDVEQAQELTARMTSHVRFLEQLAESINPSSLSANRRSHDARALFNAVCVADLFRNQKNLRQALSQALQIICPAAVATEIQESGASIIPSPSSVRRSRFSLDMCFAMRMRERNRDWADFPRFLWLDSSPMGGEDLLVGHVHILRCRSAADFLEVCHGVDELVRLQADLKNPVAASGGAMHLASGGPGDLEEDDGLGLDDGSGGLLDGGGGEEGRQVLQQRQKALT